MHPAAGGNAPQATPKSTGLARGVKEYNTA